MESIDQAKEIVAVTTDEATRFAKYKRDGATVYENDWIDLENRIAEALTQARKEGMEEAAAYILDDCGANLKLPLFADESVEVWTELVAEHCAKAIREQAGKQAEGK